MRSFFRKKTSSGWEEALFPNISGYSKTMRLAVGALLGSIACIFQSAGVFTGIGYILSMMSTGPLVLASLLAVRTGVMTYVITIFLLGILQPSEVLVFAFTTGLLGLSLGFGLKFLKRGLLIIPSAALCLTLGSSILLYGFKFPILGPSVTSHFNSGILIGIFAFSLLYSWIWKTLSITAFKFLNKVLPLRMSSSKEG